MRAITRDGFASDWRRQAVALLRVVCLLIALVTLAIHAPAALDTADGGPAFATSVQTANHHRAEGVSLLSCHHGSHHAHSLCAPPVIPAEEVAFAVPSGMSPFVPTEVVPLQGRVELHRAPPPKPFV